MRTRTTRGLLVLFVAILATGCGSYSGRSEAPSGGGSGGTTTSARSEEELFSQRVQPGLDFCRTCHVPGGVADTDQGKRFMLSSSKAADYNNLKASWQALGKGVESNRILTMPSGRDPQPHSGGAPWPQGSAPYNAMKALLGCWDNPAGCAALLGNIGGTGVGDFPLLGSLHAKHAWWSFCEGKTDDAVLPPDPRTLIQPGFNAGKAVHFNFPWKTCSEKADGQLYPRNCGELRARTERGGTMMKGNGAIGSNTFFGGNYGTDALVLADAKRYNELWKRWGLTQRPDNFDQLVAERYGVDLGEIRNPYPLPGEDPQATNGGSGQLPTSITQMRGPNGEWSGKLGFRCNLCHSGQILDDQGKVGVTYGSGNGTSDWDLFMDEVIGLIDENVQSQIVGLGLGNAPISIGRGRGLNNGFQAQVVSVLYFHNLLYTLKKPATAPQDALFFLQSMSATASTGDLNTIAWWNLAFKPSKFWNGTWSGDNTRSGTLGDFPLAVKPLILAPNLTGAAEQWAKDNSLDPEIWFMSLESPKYPGEIDTALAEQGAILFHSKNLWANGANANIRRPEGNGSCAGCHGVYSQRYAHDPAYLEDPALIGNAGYLVPLDIIGTDPIYATAISDQQAETYSRSAFISYYETYGQDVDCTFEYRPGLANGRERGYIAAPLHGIWATAPYFHNGSVPDVWSILDPDSRPAIWERRSAPARADQQGKVVMGFDKHFERAYDQDKLGWPYRTDVCSASNIPLPLAPPNCDVTGPTPEQTLASILFGNLALLHNIQPAQDWLSNKQIDARKAYNTFDYSHSNKGHEFTRALNDNERRAIIEYLKTL